jgi:hypothetical protein
MLANLLDFKKFGRFNSISKRDHRQNYFTIAIMPLK